MNQYNRLMEHINPSANLEQRLHQALDQPPARKPSIWRKYGALAACLLLVIGGTAVIQMNRTPANPGGEGGEPPVTAAAPQDYASTDELAAALPFPLALPAALPEGYALDSAADQFGTAVVVYADAEGHTLKYCMGEGEDALEGMNHAVSGTRLDGTDALLYQDSGFTSVEWADDQYSDCFITDQAFSPVEWQKLVSSVEKRGA